MDTIQLTKAMLKNKYTSKNFRGVFPCDKLPKKKVKRPSLVIANTDDSSKPGAHWVAFFVPEKGSPEYFDSIGNEPSRPEFLKFLKQNGKNFVYNDKRIQSVFSSTCGNYCAAYLLYRAKKMSIGKFMRHFTENHELNDQKIIKIYDENFKRNQFGANSIICNQGCQPQG